MFKFFDDALRNIVKTKQMANQPLFIVMQVKIVQYPQFVLLIHEGYTVNEVIEHVKITEDPNICRTSFSSK